MLDLGRYLLGVTEILLLGGLAWLGGTAVRRWLVPDLEGAPAHLTTALITLALLIWPAEALGSFGAFEPLSYLLLVGVVGFGLWWRLPRPPERGVPDPYLLGGVRDTSLRRDGRRQDGLIPALVALVVAVVALIHFAAGVKTRLSTGMTGFDSTWYHGSFAAGFFQGGDTWDLHFIAPQFLAWFYPANGELFHAAGMLAFGRDLLSPLLNLGWFVGCLVACWCIGRPYRVAAWSLVLGALALSVPALADQAGEARNDVVGIFFLLAAAAIALNAERSLRASLVVGLAAGLAAGTKLNFLLPAAVLIVGLAVIAPLRLRWKTLAAGTLAALAGGGYWYLRNLAHAGNPLPWVHHLGPIDLPAPQQALGGREAHSVLGYLTDGVVWSDWFLPGLHHGLWFLWPLLLGAALAGLILALLAPRPRPRDENRINGPEIGPSAGGGGLGGDGALAVAAFAGLASALAWLVAPTSASGPAGMPRGFESGLRYLAPALVLGLALLPTARPLRDRLTNYGRARPRFSSSWSQKLGRGRAWGGGVVVGLLLLVAVGLGYPVQRHYLESRYKDPTFAAPGLNAAFAWARDVTDSNIATTSTRQYPLFGTDLSNHVQYLGIERPHGGFEPPTGCRQFLRLLSEGDYDYAVATRDRLEPGKPPYPPSARWLKNAGAQPILQKPPTSVFKLSGPLRSSACK